MFGRKTKTSTTVTGSPRRSVPLLRDAAGAPAVDLTKVRAAGVDLAKRTEKTGISLAKRDLAGLRADVVALLDYSGSMRSAYAGGDQGQVQIITERALALGLQVDPDGQVPVIAFGSHAWQAGTATLDNYRGFVQREVTTGPMGTTNLAAGLALVEDMAAVAERPLFVFIVTDGRPDSTSAAETILRDLTHYPVFVKILATTSSAWEWLVKLDDALPGRFVDNIDAKLIADPAGMSDLEFADAMTDEWDSWVSAGQAAGLLT